MSAPLTAPSLLGSLLAGRYEIRAPLGRGGMGEVYEAVDRRLGRTVAVKVLRPELADDERFLARFRREASTAARLGHEGIVAVHDIGFDDGRTFIVMEFVAGSTLADLARDGRRLDASSIARIGAAAARALAHAHDRGVMHRDVSPANIMVTTLGAVKILDFGIARGGGDAGAGSAASRGTVAYVAPEVLRGGPVDVRADIFALGTVLREAAGPVDDGPLLDALDRATAADPTRRYITASAFAAALEADGSRATEPSSATTVRLPGRGAAGTEPIVPIATRPLATAAPALATPEAARGLAARSIRRRSGGARTLRAVAASAAVVIALGGALVLGQAFTSMSEPQPARSSAPLPVPGPTELVATASCDGLFSTGVDLAWSGSPPVKGYEIWRGDGDEARTLVARVRGVHTETFRDTGLGVDASYTYRIRAYDGPRVSSWSNVADVATPFLCLA